MKHIYFATLFCSTLPLLPGCDAAGADDAEGGSTGGDETGGADDGATGGHETDGADDGGEAMCAASCLAFITQRWTCYEPTDDEVEEDKQYCADVCGGSAEIGTACAGATADWFDCWTAQGCAETTDETCADLYTNMDDVCNAAEPGVSTGTFDHVSAGEYPCGITSEGAIVCWGRDDAFEVDGSFTQIDVGEALCALADDQSIACWNIFEEPPEGQFVDVSVGGLLACALNLEGNIQCWGDDLTAGKIEPPTDTFADVSVGDLHACALTLNGEASCFGEGVNESVPGIPMWGSAPEGTFVDIVSGPDNACARAEDGVVECWGQAGTLASPPADLLFRSIGIHRDAGCGVTMDGTLACWGNWRHGIVEGTFTEVSVGLDYACAVRSDAHVVCWGLERGSGRITPP